MGHIDCGLEEKRRFIAAMRGVAATVTVVTTEGPAGVDGATVSAFSSVSADPPTILVCLHSGSRIADAVAANGRFRVNVLPEHARFLADRFAGRHDDRIADRFDGLTCIDGNGYGPRMPQATSFACMVTQVIDSGSHGIVLGRVCDAEEGGGAPLAYLDGSYHHLRCAEPAHR